MGISLENYGRALASFGRAAAKAMPELEEMIAERRRRDPIGFLLADLKNWLRRYL